MSMHCEMNCIEETYGLFIIGSGYGGIKCLLAAP
jgi:hypothetical protein